MIDSWTKRWLCGVVDYMADLSFVARENGPAVTSHGFCFLNLSGWVYPKRQNSYSTRLSNSCLSEGKQSGGVRNEAAGLSEPCVVTWCSLSNCVRAGLGVSLSSARLPLKGLLFQPSSESDTVFSSSVLC